MREQLTINEIFRFKFYKVIFITQYIKTNPGFVFNSSMEMITQYYYSQLNCYFNHFPQTQDI